MHKFLICLRDVAEFGSVHLVGKHAKLESEQEGFDAVETMERDGFDRLFLYVSGWDDGSFDADRLFAVLTGLHGRGGYLAGGTYPALTKLRTEIVEMLSTKQYNSLTAYTSYSEWFNAVKGVSKSNKVHRLADIGLKYCRVLVPAFFTSLVIDADSEEDDRCDYCGSSSHASHECEKYGIAEDSEDEVVQDWSTKEPNEDLPVATNNVYSLADARAARGVRKHAAYEKSDAAYDFAEIMERNKRNTARVANERSGHNRSVTQKERLK